MSDLSAQDRALLRGARYTREAQQDLVTQLTRLRGDLASVGASWQGAGAVAFSTVMTAWEDQAKRVITTLEAFADGLDETDKDFTITDDDQRAAYAMLHARLGA